jgi:hypothetical protein
MMSTFRTRTQRKQGETTDVDVDAEAILAQSGNVPHKKFPRILEAATAPTTRSNPPDRTASSTAEPPRKAVRPASESEHTARVRREKPLNTSTLPPLNWLDALDKYCPLP